MCGREIAPHLQYVRQQLPSEGQPLPMRVSPRPQTAGGRVRPILALTFNGTEAVWKIVEGYRRLEMGAQAAIESTSSY